MSATPPPFPDNSYPQSNSQSQGVPCPPNPPQNTEQQSGGADLGETEVIMRTPHSPDEHRSPGQNVMPDLDETAVITPQRHRSQNGVRTPASRKNNSGLIWLAGGIAVLIAGVAIAAYCFFGESSPKRTYDYEAPVAAEVASEEVAPEEAVEGPVEAPVSGEVDSKSVVAWKNGSNLLSGVFQGSKKSMDFIVRTEYSSADGRFQNTVMELDNAATIIRLTTATVSTDGTVIYMSGQSSLGNVHIEASAQPHSNVFKGTMEFDNEQGACILTLSSK